MVGAQVEEAGVGLGDQVPKPGHPLGVLNSGRRFGLPAAAWLDAFPHGEKHNHKLVIPQRKPKRNVFLGNEVAT